MVTFAQKDHNAMSAFNTTPIMGTPFDPKMKKKISEDKFHPALFTSDEGLDYASQLDQNVKQHKHLLHYGNTVDPTHTVIALGIFGIAIWFLSSNFF